jgi:putative transposase
VLFVISVAERIVHIAGITTRPGEAWMLQVGRNLIDEESGALALKRYLVIDRDAKYTQQFSRLVEEGGTEVIPLPPMSPNLNAYAERFVRSIKDECLDRMIFIGQESLRRAVAEYMEALPRPWKPPNPCARDCPPGNNGAIRRRARLGGMLNFYRREAM